MLFYYFFFFSSRRRHTRCSRDWSSDVCSSDLVAAKKAKVPVDEAVFQLVVGLGILLVFVGACGYRWLMLVDEVALQTQLKESKTKELESLKRSEEHTSELQSRLHLVCRLLLEKKKT